MSTVTDLIDRYIAMWNETDGKRRRDLIAQVIADGKRLQAITGFFNQTPSAAQ